MPYQYTREPLLPEEASRLAQACRTVRERLVIWTLFDTGLRVSELAGLTPAQINWQGHRPIIYCKGGPYGLQSKRRIMPLSARLQTLIAHHFALHDTIGLTPRAMQLLVKRVANRARIPRPVTPHGLRHTFAVTAVQKGISLPAWLPVFKAPDGAMLLKHLGQSHPTEVGAYLARIRTTDDVAPVAAKAYEVVEDR